MTKLAYFLKLEGVILTGVKLLTQFWSVKYLLCISVYGYEMEAAIAAGWIWFCMTSLALGFFLNEWSTVWSINHDCVTYCMLIIFIVR